MFVVAEHLATWPIGHARRGSDQDMGAEIRSCALIADDHEVYRAGLSMVLRDKGPFSEIVEVGSFDQALDVLANFDIDLALFDLDMPGMAGPETLRVVREIYPDLKVLVVSAEIDESTIAAAMSAGIWAYIKKTTSLADMVHVIREAAVAQESGQALAPQVAHELQSFCRKPSLTARQREVLDRIAQGMSNKETARELNIAPGTVKIHLAALFSYFNVRNRTELVIKSRAAAG